MAEQQEWNDACSRIRGEIVDRICFSERTEKYDRWSMCRFHNHDRTDINEIREHVSREVDFCSRFLKSDAHRAAVLCEQLVKALVDGDRSKAGEYILEATEIAYDYKCRLAKFKLMSAALQSDDLLRAWWDFIMPHHTTGYSILESMIEHVTSKKASEYLDSKDTAG